MQQKVTSLLVNCEDSAPLRQCTDVQAGGRTPVILMYRCSRNSRIFCFPKQHIRKTLGTRSLAAPTRRGVRSYKSAQKAARSAPEVQKLRAWLTGPTRRPRRRAARETFNRNSSRRTAGRMKDPGRMLGLKILIAAGAAAILFWRCCCKRKQVLRPIQQTTPRRAGGPPVPLCLQPSLESHRRMQVCGSSTLQQL